MGGLVSLLNNENQGLNMLLSQIIVLIIAIVITVIIFMVLENVYKNMMSAQKNDPWLMKSSKNAKNSLNIPQDPSEEGSITLYRSHNQDKGLEFSYSFWMLIDNYTYKNGEWKHVFHKGNSTGYPLRAPGVYLHPTDNTLRFYMNTYENILDYVDVENMPMRKWICVIIACNQKDFDIYINGYLRKRHELKGLPRQNFGDVWLNLFGGFEGYMSKMKYYRRGLEPGEVANIVRDGPSTDACSGSGENPPYLDDSWWYDF